MICRKRSTNYQLSVLTQNFCLGSRHETLVKKQSKGSKEKNDSSLRNKLVKAFHPSVEDNNERGRGNRNGGRAISKSIFYSAITKVRILEPLGKSQS